MTEVQDTTTTTSFSRKTRESNASTPSELIILLHRQYPKDDKITACTRFVQKILDEGLFQRELAEAFHMLNYNKLTQKPKARTRMDAKAVEHRARVKAHMAKTLLLDTNIAGKKLREWSGLQLANFGGTLSIIGNHCGAKRVGSVFTKTTLKEFLSNQT